MLSSVFSIIFKMLDTTNACMLPTRLVSCTDFRCPQAIHKAFCCYVTYRIVSWQLYRDTYRIVEKCIAAGLDVLPVADPVCQDVWSLTHAHLPTDSLEPHTFGTLCTQAQPPSHKILDLHPLMHHSKNLIEGLLVIQVLPKEHHFITKMHTLWRLYTMDRITDQLQ